MISLILGLLILVGLGAPLALSLARSTELFVIRICDGKTKFARGRIPFELLTEIRDVVAREQLPDATLKVVVEEAVPRLIAPSSIPHGEIQQLRNLVGRFSVAQIRAGRMCR